MLEALRLENVGPAPKMDMELAPRLNLITGDNGLGKSFLLDVAWWALTRKWPHDLNPELTSGYPAQPTNRKKPAHISFKVQTKIKSIDYKSTYVARDQGWQGRSGRPWNPGLVIYAHSDGGFSVWDPARNYWRTKNDVDVQERVPGYVFSQREVWEGLSVLIDRKPTLVCKGLLEDWSVWIRENGVDAGNMAAVLADLFPRGEFGRIGPLRRLSLNDARDIPTLNMPYGVNVPILHASSGVRRVVTLAYMLMWSWSEHLRAAEELGEQPTKQVVMLFDEIESHLHPRWQRSILKSLLEVMSTMHEKATVQLIAATHSPLVLASAEPFFDPDQDAWFDLDFDGKPPQVHLRKRDFVRHGDVSNWLTSEAFDLKSARSLEGEEAIGKARALMRAPKPTLKKARAIDKELREAGLSDIDPFWVRWGYFMENLGASI